jgi:CheY-like chemotaxis protein
MNTILVIDDDEWLRSSLVVSLRNHGYLTIDAADGAAGLARAESRRPDLVLCDVNLPDIDGYEVLRQLRSQPATSAIPLILMTGNTEQNDMRHSMEEGADDYLPKPIEEATLLKAVQMRLSRKRAVEAQAREVSSRLLAIFDATPNLLLVTIFDAATEELVYLNPAGRKMLGVGEDEELGQIQILEFFRDKEGSGSPGPRFAGGGAIAGPPDGRG